MHLEVVAELIVRIGAVVGGHLLRQGVAQGVGTALVRIAGAGVLLLTADDVVVVVAAHLEVQPGEDLVGHLEGRTDGGFHLLVVVLVDIPPETRRGNVLVLVAIGAGGDTAVRALILVLVVGRVVFAREVRAGGEVFTDVLLRVAWRGGGEVEGGVHDEVVRDVVRGLHEEGQTVERVVRGRALGVLVGAGGVEGGLVVAAGDGDVGVGVDTRLEGVLIAVGIGLDGAHGAVEQLGLLAFEVLDVGAPGPAAHRILLIQGIDAGVVAGVGREVVGPGVAGLVVVVAVVDIAHEVTAEVLALQARSVIDLVETDRLGEGHADALVRLAALGGDDDRAVQTAGAVQRRSGGALQDGEGLEVVRIQVLQLVAVVVDVAVPVRITGVGDRVVQDDAVDDVYRLVVLAEGGGTADLDLRGTEQTTVGLVDFHARDLTLQGGDRGNGVRGEEFFGVHGRCRITERLGIPADTEGGDDGLGQEFAVRIHRHVDDAAPVHGNFL